MITGTRRAFTLAELLVVSAIRATIIFIPVFARARAKARHTNRARGLVQLGLAMLARIAD